MPGPMRVPSSLVDAFAVLRDLSPEEFEGLTQGLATVELSLKPEALAGMIAPDVGNLDEGVVANLVRALVSLNGFRRSSDWPIRETADAISSSEDLHIPEPEQAGFATRLRTLLETRPVVLLGKALDLGTAHDKVFLSARVLTDLRPIFGDEVYFAPEGAVLTHTLRLQFIDSEGRTDSFFVALDEEDIESLKTVLARATTKTSTLKQMLTDMGLSYLGPSEREGSDE